MENINIKIRLLAISFLVVTGIVTIGEKISVGFAAIGKSATTGFVAVATKISTGFIAARFATVVCVSSSVRMLSNKIIATAVCALILMASASAESIAKINHSCTLNAVAGWGQTKPLPDCQNNPGCFFNIKNWSTVMPKQIKAMIAKGMKLNLRDTQGWTPLHMAVFHSSPEVVSVFVANGAELNAVQIDGMTPLHIAVCSWDISKLSILLNAGANAEIRNKYGWTPLRTEGYMNGYSYHPRIAGHALPMLLKAGADPNASDKKGVTPLHYAAGEGHAPFIRLLLEAGGNPYLKTNTGYNAIDIARQHKKDFVIPRLESANCYDLKIWQFCY